MEGLFVSAVSILVHDVGLFELQVVSTNMGRKTLAGEVLELALRWLLDGLLSNDG
jgi:hypothetical protein